MLSLYVTIRNGEHEAREPAIFTNFMTIVYDWRLKWRNDAHKYEKNFKNFKYFFYLKENWSEKQLNVVV